MKESKKLFILRGLPASGKSSWAKKYVNEHPETSIILSKDGIREMLGVYWVEEREPLVSRIFHRMLHDIVSHGTFAYISSDKNAEIKSIDNNFDIIIDNTNLNIDDVNEIMNDAYLHDYKIQEVIFNMPVEKCIEGDSKIIKMKTNEMNKSKMSKDKLSKKDSSEPSEPQNYDYEGCIWNW